MVNGLRQKRPHPAFRGAKGYPLPLQAGKGNQKERFNLSPLSARRGGAGGGARAFANLNIRKTTTRFVPWVVSRIQS